MSLISSIADFLKPTPVPTPQVRKALERIGELVDPLLRSASGFERELAPAVEHVLGYCEGLIAGLPGPIDICGSSAMARSSSLRIKSRASSTGISP